MTTKTTGVEWKRFYGDKTAWPEGTWHEDEELTVDGEAWTWDHDMMTIADGAVLTVAGGIVYLNEGDTDGPSVETHFKRWRKAQSTVVFVCEAPRELEEAVRAAIKAAGGKA